MKARRIFLTMLFTVIVPGICLAGYGAGGLMNNQHSGFSYDVCSGTPFTVTGIVASMIPGEGMEIATSDGTNIVVYGVGPYRYWESMGVEKPAVGEEITVDGYRVDLNGIVRNVAMSITVAGQTIQLRDSDTCLPLWRHPVRQ